MSRAMPRKKMNYDKMPAAFAEGTFERIEAVLGPLETRTDFIREAVEKELARRERRSERDGE